MYISICIWTKKANEMSVGGKVQRKKQKNWTKTFFYDTKLEWILCAAFTFKPHLHDPKPEHQLNIAAPYIHPEWVYPYSIHIPWQVEGNEEQQKISEKRRVIWKLMENIHGAFVYCMCVCVSVSKYMCVWLLAIQLWFPSFAQTLLNAKCASVWVRKSIHGWHSVCLCLCL